MLFVVLAVAHILRRAGVATNSTSPPAAISNSQTGCFTAAQAWNEIGRSGCVQFAVGYTSTSAAGNAFLDQYSDYTTGFSVWIPSEYAFGSTAIAEYAGRTVRVTGRISSYHGAPQIEVTNSSQITSAG
jgi:hypothetical protein